MQRHTFSCQGERWSGGLQLTASRVVPLIADRFASHGIDLLGPGPAYRGPRDQVFSLRNVVERCNVASKREWPEIIRVFVDNASLMMTMEDPLAISADVARASLRLRLEDAPTVNGWPVDFSGRSLDGSGVADGSHASDAFSVSGGPTHDAHLDGEDSFATFHRIIELRLVRPGFPGASWILYMQRPGCGHAVLEEHLERWDLTVDEAFAIARANVERLPRGTRGRESGVWREFDSSMFQHNRILLPHQIEPAAPDGWIVAAPTRTDVFVVRALPGEPGLRSVARVMSLVRPRWSTEVYPASRHCWFVPPGGPGLWGETAEPILFVDASPAGMTGADVRLDFGPRLHALFGETMPVRPAPQLVL